jgi:hypothetical protein
VRNTFLGIFIDNMKDLIKKILKEQLDGLDGSEDKPLSEKEIRLFRYLNKHKGSAKTQSELIELIKTMMPMIDRSPYDARFYYEVYTANYRPEGDYENLDGKNFVDYKGFKQRKTPNNNAYTYTIGRIPFKGSNLEGIWDVNRNNEWYYVVKSYNWYPIYLYIEKQWYRVSNTYSSSTSKQMSHADPRRQSYDSRIKDDVITVTPEEIKSIMNGESLSNIKTNRVTNFNDRFAKSLKGTKKLLTIGWGDDRKKVDYTIMNVKKIRDKIKFEVNINKAGTVEGTNKMVINPDGYVHPSPFSEDLEKGITDKIISDNKDFISRDNATFVFQHPK